MAHLWESPKWPDFYFDSDALQHSIGDTARAHGELVGRLKALGHEVNREVMLSASFEEAVNTSGIEGEVLNRQSVRASLQRAWGMRYDGALTHVNQREQGVVSMLLDATANRDKALTKETLCNWHRLLFAGDTARYPDLIVGAWRDDAKGRMEIVSGGGHRKTVHYVAPPAPWVEREMRRFIEWFNAPATTHHYLKAAQAHAWLVKIHPFGDGNGRISRALFDMCLSRGDGMNDRIYSVSQGIVANGTWDYHTALDAIDEDRFDLTEWAKVMCRAVQTAAALADRTIDSVLARTLFWDEFRGRKFNPRQQKIIGLILSGQLNEFHSGEWMKRNNCSRATALRDINELVAMDVLSVSQQGGRSTRYSPNEKFARDARGLGRNRANSANPAN